MANKKNSSTFEIDDFNIADAAIAANGGQKAVDTSNEDAPKKESKPKTVKQVTEAPSNRPELPKGFQDKFFDNIFSYDRSPDKGRPVYISSDLLDSLQALSERHYKRLSLRAIVQSVLASFLAYDTDKTVEAFLKKINFQVPTQEELNARKIAAKKAKERRAAEK